LFFVIIIDELVRSRKKLFAVIPAEAGIQKNQGVLDSRSRFSPGQASFGGSDGPGDFLQSYQH